MGFSLKTWGPKWAEYETYADMPEIVCRFLQKAYGLSKQYATLKNDPFTIFHSYHRTPQEQVAHPPGLHTCKSRKQHQDNPCSDMPP